MKNNKKEKISSICFLASSICFYISALASFINKNNSVGVICLCLGSTNLCLASVYKNMAKK